MTLDELCSIETVVSETRQKLERIRGRANRYADLFLEDSFHQSRSLHQKAARHVVRPAVRKQHFRNARGMGLQVLDESGRRVYFIAHGLQVNQLIALIEAADTYRGDPEGIFELNVDRESDSTQDTDLIQDFDLLERAADAALSLDDAVTDVYVELQAHSRRICVLGIQSPGTLQTGHRTDLLVQVRRAGLDRPVYATGSLEGFRSDLRTGVPEQLAVEAVERSRIQVDARHMPSGAYPVILASGWGGVWLHEAVGHLFEADVALAAGYYCEPGRRVAAPEVTVVDDPTLAGGRGSFVYDDEGTPASKKLLVEQGIFRQYLTDRSVSSRTGWPHTANGRRQDYRSIPLPRMSNLCLAAGTARPEDLVSDVREGIYVRVPSTGVTHPAEGKFLINVLEGYRIENGRIGYPVTGIHIQGDGRNALARIRHVGSDFTLETGRGLCLKEGQVLPVGAGMPTILLDELEVISG